jgi:hypothetical protein
MAVSLPTVTVTVNSKTYSLIWKTSRIIEMQRRVKATAGEVLRRVGEMSVDDLAELTFTLLQPNHASEFKTLDQVCDWIDDIGGYEAMLRLLLRLTEEMKARTEAANVALTN